MVYWIGRAESQRFERFQDTYNATDVCRWSLDSRARCRSVILAHPSAKAEAYSCVVEHTLCGRKGKEKRASNHQAFRRMRSRCVVGRGTGRQVALSCWAPENWNHIQFTKRLRKSLTSPVPAICSPLWWKPRGTFMSSPEAGNNAAACHFSSLPISSGCRFRWKRMKRRIHWM